MNTKGMVWRCRELQAEQIFVWLVQKLFLSKFIYFNSKMYGLINDLHGVARWCSYFMNIEIRLWQTGVFFNMHRFERTWVIVQDMYKILRFGIIAIRMHWCCLCVCVVRSTCKMSNILAGVNLCKYCYCTIDYNISIFLFVFR